MIDFLEDPEFRDWILHPEEIQVDGIRPDWDEIVHQYKPAQQARYILISLKSYFERHQLSEEAIQSRLQVEIEKYRLLGKTFQRRRTRTIWAGRTAAGVLLLIGLFFILKWMNRPLDVYRTDFGERITIALPDSSIIQLNSNSTLTWNRKWEKDNQRVVNLDGEAFFQVRNKNNMPFQVNTDDLTVHVIGTQFNVNSRRQQTQIYLEEGKVDVAVKNQPERKYMMGPGDELVYQAQSDRVEKKNIRGAEEVSAWKEGLLIFRDEPLLKVLESVSDIYGKEFVTKDSALLHRNITTTIPLTNWEVSLMAIQLAMKLEVEQENDTIRIKEKE